MHIFISAALFKPRQHIPKYPKMPKSTFIPGNPSRNVVLHSLISILITTGISQKLQSTFSSKKNNKHVQNEHVFSFRASDSSAFAITRLFTCSDLPFCKLSPHVAAATGSAA